MVHTHGTAPRVRCHKRTVHKGLGGTLGQLPVAAADLNARKAQLALGTEGKELPVGAYDEVPRIGHGLAYGDVVDTLAGPNLVIGGVVGALGGTVDVDNLYMVAVDALKLLAAGGDEAYGEVRVGVYKQRTDRCAVAAAGDAVAHDEIAHGSRVLAYLGRHDMERAAERQDGIHVLDMRVEGERTVTLYAVGGGQALHVDDDVDEVPQAGLVEHCALGLAGGAGRVYHIRKTVRRGEVDRGAVCPRGREVHVVKIYHRGISCVKAALGLLPVKDVMRGQQHAALRVGDHIVQALGRVLEVEGSVRCAGLVDGQDRQGELLAALQKDTHEAVGDNALADEAVCQGIGPLAQLTVGQATVTVDNADILRTLLCTLLKGIYEGLRDVNVKVLSG